ncbi:MAG: hypothetical protein JW891_16710, partial [Candidatus Lokiarchaeota archaeon]|nr:hypothetical protein [Candidatus Lokiarchaeota archaeon]
LMTKINMTYKCDICGQEFKRPTSATSSKHINGIRHQAALQKKGIKPSIEVSKKIVSKARTINSTLDSELKEMKKRILFLEKAFNVIQNQQNKILKHLNITDSQLKGGISIDRSSIIGKNEILSAIKRCVRNNTDGSRWVALDDIISILKLHREEDRSVLNKILIRLFNQNLIDLSEGGDPKYPVYHQNRIFGMVALQ